MPDADLIAILLGLIALYCFGMWTMCFVRTMKYDEDYREETFHLGLCMVLALGFVLLYLR